MATTAADLEDVLEFRNRLVAYANYIRENVVRFVPTPEATQQHIGEESAWLAQEYGRVFRLIQPYGIAQMTQFRQVASTDVVRDTIGSPSHPSYVAMAGMAIQHLDMVIGRMRADLEGGHIRSLDRDALYRITSPVYWMGRLVAVLRWVIGTNAGRIIGGLSVLGAAIIGGIASGVAQGWYESLTR